MRITLSLFAASFVVAIAAGGCAPVKLGGPGDPCTYSSDCMGSLVCASGVCHTVASGPQTYDNCSTQNCASSSDTCTIVMSGASTSFCTRACTTGTDCPRSRDGDPAGVCLPVLGGATVCYSHCTSTSNCPAGWICNPSTMRGAACTPM
jgi:hypothetical protein